MAITNHSKTGNVNQLRHDLCNGPAHVFGDHSNCNPDFCSHRSIPPSIDDDDEELATETLESDANTTTAQQFVDQLDNILDQLEAHHSKQDEDDAIQGGHSSLLNQLPPGLFNKVMACGDRLVMLAHQLISNQTSNLAECYMSIRCHFDGGKQYNRIQCGAFQHRCAAAGLAIQHGPTWGVSFWKNSTSTDLGEVMSTYATSRQQQLHKDRTRKQSFSYKSQRRASKRTIAVPQHHYGPDSQQEDIPPADLAQLCSEYYKREVEISRKDAQYIEEHTTGQADDSLWHQQRRLRLTASNFGKIAKRRQTTPVANIVKSLLYGKQFTTEATRWGLSHEEEAKKCYVEYLRVEGHPNVTVKSSGLVIDTEEPSLACSPDGLVKDPESPDPRGICELKCPYNLAKDLITPVEAAKDNKSFCCKLGTQEKPELKRTHNYFYQVQGALAISRHSWCDFVVWSPAGISVERIAFDTEFWEETKRKLLHFYKSSVLPELALPRHKNGQPIREPISGDDVTISA